MSLAKTVAQSSAGVEIASVSKRYGATLAVDEVSLTIEPGEFVTLLGPSGSGKTTLLMMLAGFEIPTAGRLAVGSRDITSLAANKRNIGMVFQKYALFPHMTVAENIAYPLRVRGVGKAEREARVRSALAAVKLSGYELRMPAALSGGQQQRVALARAIVFDPPLILMDEPLGALDRRLRQHMQIEIKQLQQRLGATVIFVTHDQEEALTMSDRVAILDHGKLMQYGAPEALYHNPENMFVAEFLGEMNFLEGTVRGRRENLFEVDVEGHRLGARPAGVNGIEQSDTVRVAVRPSLLQIGAPSRPNSLAGKVTQVLFAGTDITVLVELTTGHVLQAKVNSRVGASPVHAGDAVSVWWESQDALAFGRAN